MLLPLGFSGGLNDDGLNVTVVPDGTLLKSSGPSEPVEPELKFCHWAVPGMAIANAAKAMLSAGCVRSFMITSDSSS
jgi:hypothetical protein